MGLYEEWQMNKGMLSPEQMQSSFGSTQAAAPPKPKRGFSLIDLLPGGSLIQKKRFGEKITAGDVALEAALTFVPFGLGKTAKVVKAGSAAVKGAGATRGLKSAEQASDAITQAKAAAQQAAKSQDYSFVKRAGFNLSGKARGITGGAKAPKMPNPISPQRADELNDFLTNTVKVSASNPNKQLRQLVNFRKQASTELNDHIASYKLKTAPKDLSAMKRDIGIDLSNLADKRGVEEIIKSFDSRLATAKDIPSLLKARRSFDKVINYTTAGVDAKPAVIAKIYRQHIDKLIQQRAPGVKDLDRLVSLSSDAEKLLLKEAGKGGILDASKMGGLGGMVGASAQKLSRPAMAKAGKYMSGQTTAPKVARFLAGQGATRAAYYGGKSMMGGEQAPEEMGLEEADLASLGGDMSGMGDMGDLSSLMPEQEQAFNKRDFVLQNLNNVGSAEELADLLSMADSLEQVLGAPAGMSTADLPADQRKTITAASNAESVIDEIEQAFNLAGGAGGGVVGTARNLAGKARIDAQARMFNDLRQGFLSRIARAFGEVGTLNEGDIQRALNAMPSLADTPETASYKLQVLRRLMATAKQRAMSGEYATFGEETMPASSGEAAYQLAGAM